MQIKYTDVIISDRITSKEYTTHKEFNRIKMKSIFSSLILLSVIVSKVYAQDTFSIVAADSTTREVGSAGASCVDLFSAGITDPGFIGDLLSDTGAINTQASYSTTNQNNARSRMRAGDTPNQIVSWLNGNDATFNPTIRQYGIVGFTGNNLYANGFTGANCQNYKNHITGSINGIYYSIQGNILLGQHVLDSMESKFRNAEGDLACRLMSALQGANIVGADTRCAPNGTSSLFAFVKVSQPSDPYGNSSFNVSVRTISNAQIEPVDTLQALFDLQHNCLPTSINQTISYNYISVYPNPVKGILTILTGENMDESNSVEIIIFSLLGKNILNNKLSSAKNEIDLSSIKSGLYFYQIKFKNSLLKTGKLIVE